MPMYRLTKLPDGPRKEGSVSQSLKAWEAVCAVFRASGAEGRPTVGEHLLVGFPFRVEVNVPSARVTSEVVRVISGEPDRVVFETLSGSTYEWVRFETS